MNRGGLSLDERGSVTVFVVGVLLALMVVAGLVFDGGSIIAGHREADAEAQGAARAAADQIATISLHSGNLAIDPAAARAAVDTYLAPYHHTGTITVNADNVTVIVTFPVAMQVLSIVGVDSKTVTGTGSATAIEGGVP